MCLNFSRRLYQIFHIFVCNFSREILVERKKNFYRQKKNKSFQRMQLHITPSIFFGILLRREALGYNSYFYQKSRFTEIIRRQIHYTSDKVYSKANHQSKVAELKRLLFGESKIAMKNFQTTDPKTIVCSKERQCVRKMSEKYN